MPATDMETDGTSEHLPLNPQVLWLPKNVSDTRMEKLRHSVNAKFKLELKDYHELYDWSCAHLSDFWALMWAECEIKASKTYDKVLDESVSMDKIPEWFPGARLNFAENLLRYRDDRLALIATGESGFENRWTYRQVYDQVAQCSAAMRALGVQKGDRVVAYIPNCAEAVVIMLAASSIGAIYSSTSPDFGTTGVLDRFIQVKPKLLFSVNAVVYNGKTYDHMDKVKAVAKDLPELIQTVIVPFVDVAQHPTQLPDQTWSFFADFLKRGNGAPLTFEQLPFNHPLYILYSSGTTGKPKCIVHSAGGVLIQHLKEHLIHGDMNRDDVFFQYTTTGWMMWNWLVSGLAVGCTLVLFDGSPFKPHNWVLWDLADRLKVTRFGTSAKFIQSMQEMDIKPSTKYQLPFLKDIYSTGSPLRPESFEFVYQWIKKDVCLGSITGGTDIVSLFAGHNHTLPVYKGEIQSRCLGMAIQAWTEDYKPVEGHSGDLVCYKTFPCMPVFFWEDPDNKKYKDAYFNQAPGVWYHGDYVWINPNTKGVVMLGRSDGTLKPAGVRFGSAELYNIVEKYAGVIADSLAVGQRRPQDSDERVLLFLKMCPGHVFSKELADRLKVHIRKELSPRHVPAFILPIDDIPYTINGKKVEVAVKKIVSGQQVQPSATLANPDSLKLYENIPEIQ